MEYEKWLTAVPEDLKRDPLWQFNIYPKTVFLYDLLWEDCERLLKDTRGKAISEQIIRLSKTNIQEEMTQEASLATCILHPAFSHMR